MNFPVHTLNTAPQDARDTLRKISEAWGFLPNVGAVLSESPAALELLWTGYGAVEQQLVSVAASRENGCAYCLAAHSTLALQAKLPDDALTATRN